jgi:hypothetical protein
MSKLNATYAFFADVITCLTYDRPVWFNGYEYRLRKNGRGLCVVFRNGKTKRLRSNMGFNTFVRSCSAIPVAHKDVVRRLAQELRRQEEDEEIL